jgi:RimJ/RimL family protein N-acetyltransferase
MQGGVIQTERLTLRPLTPEDAGDIAAALADWNVARWLTRVPHPYAPADAVWFLGHPVSHGAFAIETNGRFVGVVHIGATGELGYWLAPACHGQGLMTEAAHAAVDAHFAQGGSDLTSGYHIGNDASAKVLEKLGFRVTGHTLTPTARGDDVVIRRVVLAAQDWHNRLWITTPRLVIRPLRPTDIVAIIRIGSQPDVARMLMSVPSPWPAERARAWMENSAWRGRSGFRLAVCLLDGTVIGCVGLGGNPVGCMYFIDPDHAGRGYATEAMQAMLADSFGRFNIHAVIADHFTDNPASGRVLQKLGFEKSGDGIGRSAARVEPAPIVHYRLIQPNLKARTP